MITSRTLVEALQQQSRQDRSITFIEARDNEVTRSFAELHDRSITRLYALQQRGMTAGDECIVFLRSNEEFVEVFWACILGGIVPIPIAVGISDEHRSKLFNVFTTLEKPFLCASSEDSDRLREYAEKNSLADLFQSIEEKTLLNSETDPLSKENKNQSGSTHTPAPDDLAFIQFSSGSTSTPKGVMLSHRNIMTNLDAIARGAAYTDEDISFSWMPLTHDMGLIGFHLNMIAMGMSQCLMATDLFSRRPLLWLKKVSDKKATVLCSPNFGYKHFLKAQKKKPLESIDLSAVRLIYNGAEPISIDLCDNFLNTMKPYGLKRETMFTVYGMAEATLAVSFPAPGENFRAVHVDRNSLVLGQPVKFTDESNSNALSFAIVGKGVNECNIRIADGDRELEHGCVGNIQISGASVTSGYYNNSAATEEVMFPGGWLDTGDLGFIYQGELIITGRAKDIIFFNGLNYYPHDLEGLLQQIENLELGKTVVFGVWNESLERDELLVFILHRGDLSKFLLLAAQVSRVLNEQSGLDADHVIPVNRIPKTTSGKVQRRLLGDAYQNGEYNEVLTHLDALANPQATNDAADLTPMERELKSICDNVLEKGSLGRQDNFFDAGISSLMLAEIHQQIDERYPDKVDVVDLFDYQTIEDLAEFMLSKE
ncbi:MAG: AMP-binding protein [Halioglobus sp.]